MLRALFVVFALAAAAPPAPTPLPPAELAAEIRTGDAPLILDVRTREEYDAGHVPGAILIPYDQVEARIGELGAPREVALYCRSGRRASLAQPVLEKHGFTVRQVQGSWEAWQAAGLPQEPATSEATAAPVAPVNSK